MSDSELYPGLDTELDEAFARHNEQTAEKTPTTLGQVVASELPERFTSSDTAVLEREIVAFSERATIADNVHDMQEILDDRAQVIKELMWLRSDDAQKTVEHYSDKARDQVAAASAEDRPDRYEDNYKVFEEVADLIREGKPEAATSYITDNIVDTRQAERIWVAVDEYILEEAVELVDRSQPDQALGYIDKYASSAEAANKMKIALDKIVLLRAIKDAESGQFSLAYGYISSCASNPSTAVLMKRALDDTVLERAGKTANDSNMTVEARSIIKNFSSSKEVGFLMRQALDPIVLRQAVKFKQELATDMAKLHIRNTASTDAMKDRMIGVLS